MQAKDLKVLMVSTDRQILTPGSSVSARMKEYGGLLESLHIILLCDKKHGLRESKLSDNVFVHPTNSWNRFLRPFDAVREGIMIDCDIITTQDPFECGWVGMKLKKEKNVPIEVQLHTDMFSPYFSGTLNTVRKLLSKNIFLNADAIRVVRPSLGDKIAEKFGVDNKKISVLPIYIDNNRFVGEPKFNLREDERFRKFEHIVLTVSRLTKEKNLPMIIEAMVKVSDTALVIIGSGVEMQNLKDLTKKLRIDDRVFFEGWKEDVLSYYKSVDLLVQASSFEGYGMTLVEAAMCDLPAISTPTGVAENFPEIAKAEDISSFTKRINYLLQNKSIREELGKNLKQVLGINGKEEFLIRLKESWENLARKT